MQRTEFVEMLLKNRGITDDGAIEKFLNPSYERDLFDPYLMHDMEKACVRIYEAIEAKEKIVIYSDYDCDGIPGAVILHDFFKKVGYEHFSNYIPHRHTEGYGLHHEAVEEFIKNEVKLIITVDLGTNNVSEIAAAKVGGIDTIVTDHHLPKEVLPHAFALVNPKLVRPNDLWCWCGI